ncbi:hypothetical protein, conserved [Eimeria tenella]|uniref:Uncharacterized protein n=1 Tax=Eimeria tenella TaxID=5802 RepID=U6KZZ1_EIMTE|nr:hypothetical protein, conserved [Eimeria tenella]CDJ42488.1 hypothetical protein, conserved [Eimeria tenella]|eukprot:XP_013233238.1 hypothetical protein, conserved [Eimeria tenella]
MQLSGRVLGLLFAVGLVCCSTMPGAAAAGSSPEELQQHLDNATQVVEFSHVGGAESADTAEIRVPVGATVVVRLQSVGGYRPVLVSAQSGAVGLSELSQASPSSAEDVKHLIEQGPSIPEGLQVQLPTPFTPPTSGGGMGLMGAPVPFLSVIRAEEVGTYSLRYDIVRPWAPSDGTQFLLKLHVEKS